MSRFYKWINHETETWNPGYETHRRRTDPAKGGDSGHGYLEEGRVNFLHTNSILFLFLVIRGYEVRMERSCPLKRLTAVLVSHFMVRELSLDNHKFCVILMNFSLGSTYIIIQMFRLKIANMNSSKYTKILI